MELPVPDLPVTDPVLIVAITMGILLVGPMLFERLRIPGLVGLIALGAVAGPSVTGLLERDATFQLLGTFGLLYLMFVAGVTLDLGEFNRQRRRAIGFGLLSFALPFALAMAVGPARARLRRDGGGAAREHRGQPHAPRAASGGEARHLEKHRRRGGHWRDADDRPRLAPGAGRRPGVSGRRGGGGVLAPIRGAHRRVGRVRVVGAATDLTGVLQPRSARGRSGVRVPARGGLPERVAGVARRAGAHHRGLRGGHRAQPPRAQAEPAHDAAPLRGRRRADPVLPRVGRAARGRARAGVARGVGARARVRGPRDRRQRAARR